MQKVLLPILLAAALTAAGAYYFGATRPSGDSDEIRLSGNIEVIDAQVSFKIAGRVERRPVDEGMFLEKGALVALLDTSDLKLQVDQRRAEWGAAKATLEALEAGSRPQEIAAAKAAMEKAAATLDELHNGTRHQDIAVAEAALSSAKADEARAGDNFHRITQLPPAATSADEVDRAKSAYVMAREKMRQAAEQLNLAKEGPRREEIEQAKAALAQAQQQYDMIKIGPRKEDIDAGRARADQAEAAYHLAEVTLGYATLRAPMSGVVLSKNIEPGEYVMPGTPIVTMGDLKNVWLRAYVNETDLGRVKLGQSARMTTDTYPGRVYQGRVSFISDQAEFTPKTVQTQQQRVKLVYRIKIDVDNTKMELKPGMPADAVIDTASGYVKPMATAANR
jgi:HlyD family secretion protein